MSKVPINMIIEEELKKEFQEQAEARGITLTELIINATKLYSGFDEQILKILRAMSKDFQLSDSQLLQSTFADWSAKRTAGERMNRKGTDLFPEFMMNSDGVVTGFELYKNLVYLHLYEQSDPQAPTSDEPDELELRIQQCRRKADLLRIRSAVEKGLIPKDTIPSPNVARLVEMHEKGEIDDEELKRKIDHYKREAGWK